MLNNSTSSPRDRSRCPMAKLASLTRRQERRIKSARLFLALAFPPELEEFKRTAMLSTLAH